MITKNIGGDRLGSGAKLNVDMKTYSRSSHDLSYLWRSSMASGTLIPFMSEVALPGDSHDIDLDCDVKTHPTIGPLFGSYKLQLDVFSVPMRLYNAKLHMNMLGIGMKMNEIYLPKIHTILPNPVGALGSKKIDNWQINASNILKYLGISGNGLQIGGSSPTTTRREWNAIPLLAYADIFKNYYANKQEEKAWVIDGQGYVTKVSAALYESPAEPAGIPLPKDGTVGFSETLVDSTLTFYSVESSWESTSQIEIFVEDEGLQVHKKLLTEVYDNVEIIGNQIVATDFKTEYTDWFIRSWDYNPAWATGIELQQFDLKNIDDMRLKILRDDSESSFVIANDTESTDIAPYTTGFKIVGDQFYSRNPMQGILVKTYQSDLFNNWIQTEWIDGDNGISAITAIDTSEGNFTIDSLNLANKVYNMLNRIAISGGTYDDWLETVYTHDNIRKAENPIYMGSLIKEVAFEEVVSNAATEAGGDQPLGTLAGRGVMTKKHKGGKITIKTNEPSYIMGIVSLTPRVDYSQGNKWDMNLNTMDDLHKPELDEIGYQDLITDQMAWWSTTTTFDYGKTFRSAGKQPAWLNYMTNVNRVFGSFAEESNEMFMTLNRRYEFDANDGGILDLTTYIDPSKFNFIFAETDLNSQNFWVQISVDMTARRKMSAKIMPNL